MSDFELYARVVLLSIGIVTIVGGTIYVGLKIVGWFQGVRSTLASILNTLDYITDRLPKEPPHAD